MPEFQEIVIRITGDTTGISAKLNSLKSQLASMGQNVSASNDKLVQSTQAMEKHVSASYNQMTRMAHMFQSALFYMAGSTVFRAINGFFDAIINKGLQFNAVMAENRIALKTMLGDVAQAEMLLQQVWEIAAKTPFQFKELAEITKQMIAFGFEAEKVPGLLWDMADAVAALGGGMEKAQRVAINLGQILALGRINAREIRDLSTQGINMYKALADYLSITTRDVAKLVQKAQIDAQTAVSAFSAYVKDKYGGMAAYVQQQYSGLMATFKDYTERIFGESMYGVFQLITRVLREINPQLEDMAKNLEKNREANIKWWEDAYEAAKKLSPVMTEIIKAFKELGVTTSKIITDQVIGNTKAGVFDLLIGKGSVLYDAAKGIQPLIKFIGELSTTVAKLTQDIDWLIVPLKESIIWFERLINPIRTVLYFGGKLFEVIGSWISKLNNWLIVKEKVFGPQEGFEGNFIYQALHRQTKLADDSIKMMEDWSEKQIDLYNELEDRIYELTHTAHEKELKELEETYRIKEQKAEGDKELLIKLEEAKRLEISAINAKYNEKDKSEIEKQIKAIQKLKEEEVKFLIGLYDKYYELTHTDRENELRKLELWYEKAKAEALKYGKGLELVEKIHVEEVKQLNDKWRQEDLEKQQEFLDQKKKAQEEYVKFEIESWNRMYEHNTAEMKKYYEGRKSYQDFIDEYTLTERQKEFKRLSEFLNDLYAQGAITWDEVIKGIEMGMVAYDSKTATANYTSLLQMQKDMEEFLKDFDMEKFKLNAQKVIDLSLEAAKFISTLTINLDPAVAEKLKEINKTFNEVTIGNLTEMITSFTNFYKAVEEAGKTKQVDPTQIDKLINDLTDFIVMFVEKTIEWAKALKGDNYLLPAIKLINETFKDITLNEFMATMRSIFGLMEYINELKFVAVDPLKIDDMMKYFTDFIVMFVGKTIEWGKAIKGDNYLLPALKELNETFKDTSINEFMGTLKNMFDLINFINELEYKPVSEAKLDSMLTYLTEFMILLANRTKIWVESLKNDNLLESMRELNKTFKDTTLNEFIGTIKSVFELVKLFEDSPNYNASTAVNNIVDFLINLESFVIALDNALISIGRERLGDIATRSRETFGYLNKLFKDISLDEFMKMVKSLDEVLERFTPKFDEQGKQVADLLSDVANVASRIKWFFTQLDTLAVALEKMFEGEEGKYLEAVSERVKSAFGRLNNAFKDITLIDFTNFMSMLKNFEESVMKDKNGVLMTSLDIDKVKVAIIGMLKALENLSKELDQVMGNSEYKISNQPTSWIDTLKQRLENTIGKAAEIMQYALDKMMNIRNSWNLLTGAVTDIKAVYLTTILECVTGLSEMLDSPLWKGIIDKVENVYIKVGNRLFGIQGDFENMRVTVESTLQKLTKNLDQSFTNLINTISNAQSGISDKLTDLGIAVEESKAVEKLSGLGKSLDGIVITMDNMVSKIGTWIVAFTKFCFTIAYLATLAMRAVEQFNLEMERMLKMAGAFKAFVMEIKPLMEDMIKLFGTWGELMKLYGGWVENLTESNQSRGGNWSENFGKDPWDYPPNYGTGTIQVGYGDRMPIEDYPGYGPTPVHPGTGRNSINPPIIIQGDLVLQGVQNPQQLMDELKRLGNMRGAVNANYNY
jgi:tape measure domain-containing protein